MFSPQGYTVRKITFSEIVENDFQLHFTAEDGKRIEIKQQDNQLFRQIRLITGDERLYNKWIVFVDCGRGKSNKSALHRLVREGFNINQQHFVISERSASMVRTSILSFVDDTIENELNVRITMDIKFDKTVLSKYYAYRGLMLSASHNFEGWYPKIIVVPDFDKIIPDQKIKYVYDKTTTYEKDGRSFDWVQKDIATTTEDIQINAFDGCGIHHPAITSIMQKKLKSKTAPTCVIWRAPYIKGLTFEMDYVRFYAERGIKEIQDIWGEWHSVTADAEPMIIMTLSMYKGYKYFNNTGTEEDWKEYWRRFKKYDHCIGISKWNFGSEEEPVYTRGNYQILQDLGLSFDEFQHIADYSVDWAEKIINGDYLYTMCFLGLTENGGKSPVPSNDYMRAILKNPVMLKEAGVRKYLSSLIKKYKDDMKCGKLWLKACYKFLAPDLIMLMEHIGGIENPQGVLSEGEFFTFNKDGVYDGEYLIERNPHICKSEHTVLKAVNNEMLQKYCGHLVNVAMINTKSIVPQRLNGADFDGDLVLVIDDERLISGVDRDVPIVMDIEDKVTTLEEADTLSNRTKVILRGMTSIIGEISNCATAYHNKTPKDKETYEKYESYIDLLSVINGKAIDSAKTGVVYNIPRYIAKYGKPMPYFMRYVSDYYKNMRRCLKSRSNMNRLCWELEHWDRSLSWRRTGKDFDYHIMIDENVEIPDDIMQQIEQIYLEYSKEMHELTRVQSSIRNYTYGDGSLEGEISRADAKVFTFNWQSYFDKYKQRCLNVCSDIKMLANAAVKICYEMYPKRNKNFVWKVAGKGIVENLKQVDVNLPCKDDDGEYEYLGKRYTMKPYKAKEEV